MSENSDIQSQTDAPKPQKEGVFANLLLNVVIPTLILMKLSGEVYLGPVWALIVALSFPISYGLHDLVKKGKVNFFSALGIIGVVLTGGISLLKLDPAYIAIKEAAVPGLIGLATLVSLKTRYPLIRTFLYNDKILKTDKVAEALREHGTERDFDKCLINATYLVASSFFLSSALNYILAKVILVSEPGTEAFNEELGKMMGLSFPVIAVPSTLILVAALFYLFRRIRQLTHLSLEDIIHEH